MGAIQPYWDETYLAGLFNNFKTVVSVKIMRSTPSSSPVGYAFVEFESVDAARAVLDHFHGSTIPGTSVKFRLNWRTKSVNSDDRARSGRTEVPSLYVGDLSAEVTSEQLFQAFAERFASCTSAKVIRDQNTDRSKGYGFVDFKDYNEFLQALQTMRGVKIGSKPIRTGTGKPKGPGRFAQHSAPSGPHVRNTQNPYDPQGFTASQYDYSHAGGVRLYNPPLPFVPRPYIQYPAVHVQQPWQTTGYMPHSQFPLVNHHGSTPGLAFPHGNLYPVTPVAPHHSQQNVQQHQQPQQLQQPQQEQQQEQVQQRVHNGHRTSSEFGQVSGSGETAAQGYRATNREDSEDLGRPSNLTPEQPSNESPELLEAEPEMERQEATIGARYDVNAANKAYVHQKSRVPHHSAGVYHSGTNNRHAIDSNKLDTDSKTE